MKEIKKLRKELDDVDTELVELILKRITIAKNIVQLKREFSLNVTDLEREETILRRVSLISKSDAPFIKSFFKRLFLWIKEGSF